MPQVDNTVGITDLDIIWSNKNYLAKWWKREVTRSRSAKVSSSQLNLYIFIFLCMMQWGGEYNEEEVYDQMKLASNLHLIHQSPWLRVSRPDEHRRWWCHARLALSQFENLKIRRSAKLIYLIRKLQSCEKVGRVIMYIMCTYVSQDALVHESTKCISEEMLFIPSTAYYYVQKNNDNKTQNKLVSILPIWRATDMVYPRS